MKKTTSNDLEKVDAEDVDLFRHAVGVVNSIPYQNRVMHEIKENKPVSQRPPLPPSKADNLLDLSANEDVEEYLKNGISRITLRKLRRGDWPIENTLDLHGNNIEISRRLLQEFILKSVQHHMKCVLVIHGKGLNSPEGESVLRKFSRNWLTQIPNVLGFCDAPVHRGGSGAVMVLLKISH